MTSSGLKSLEFDIHYQGVDSFVDKFVIPALRNSRVYCRSAGYFSTSSLASVAQGLKTFVDNDGKMNLLIGLHLFEGELAQAHEKVKSGPKIHDKDALRKQLKKLINEIGIIEDVFLLDSVATLVKFIKSGIIEIKFANPVKSAFSEIFHIKHFVFEDEDGNYVSASGSPNETLHGHRGNYEALTVFRSWDHGEEYATRIRRLFWDCWEGRDEDLEILTLGEDDIEELDKAVAARKKELRGNEIYEGTLAPIIRDFKNLVPAKIFDMGSVRLYPHQEATYLRALSRWPVRCILGDEVGLGKTIELGSIAKYLLDTDSIQRIMILAPKNVCLQFQDELATGFGINLLYWDSSKKLYLDPKGNQVNNQNKPGKRGSPELVILSSQLARGTKNSASILDEMDEMPDLLVVDEAHAARVPPPEAKTKPTLLHEKLSAISGQIPHLILMTATPMQIELSEYHGLLSILGLPKGWEKLKNFQLALEAYSLKSPQMLLNDANQLAQLLASAASRLNEVDKDARAFLEVKKQGSQNQTALHVKKNWAGLRSSLLKVNPATHLTIRSTKANLADYGYKFPERVFREVSLEFPKEILTIRRSLNAYLDDAYGLYEKELSVKKKKANVAFVRSVYEQRFASSLSALYETLVRRRSKLTSFLEGNKPSANEFGQDDFENEDDESIASEQEQLDLKKVQQVTSAIKEEFSYLVPLISTVSQFQISGHVFEDPKLESAKEAVLRIVNQGRKPLVFSRYRDTIQSFLGLIDKEDELTKNAYGLYTGSECWIRSGGKQRDRTKAEIQADLKSGEIGFLLCSDAASEGLNLQTADTLINLDVPWNPARLEQRIGRIARLGQKSESVEIQNVWYSNSVEAIMYQRLLTRKDFYDLAVGQFPDIVSKQIRSKLSELGMNADEFSDSLLIELQDMRTKLEKLNLNKIWDQSGIGESNSSKVWKRLDTLADSFVEKKNSGNVLDDLAYLPFSVQSPNATLFSLSNKSGVWRFEIEADGIPERLKVEASVLPELIYSLLHGVEFEIWKHAAKDWMPNHAAYLPYMNEQPFKGRPPSASSLESVEIGRLKIKWQEITKIVY